MWVTANQPMSMALSGDAPSMKMRVERENNCCCRFNSLEKSDWSKEDIIERVGLKKIGRRQITATSIAATGLYIRL